MSRLHDFLGVSPDTELAVVSDERATQLRVERAERAAKRTASVAYVLPKLALGESHLFEQYVVSAQISASVGRMAAIHGRAYRCERVAGKGVKVTRTK